MEKELLADAKHRMDKAVEAVKTEFNTVRSGRASVGLLDRIHVDYYGTSTPLKQMANIATPESRLLTIQPFDKTAMKSIEKAIMESDLGLNPSSDGSVIRLPIPALTEERRRDLVKLVHRLAEDGARRGAQRAPRLHEGPQGARPRGRGRRGRGEARRGRAAEVHGRPRAPRSTSCSSTRKPEILEV